ncbi:MAG: dTDP-4-dehydrorhamnose reductase [Chlorobi bacterium]|nr:dTDP-4-dehydrorhamnose reductase [Chlorobiota bacterium]
MKKIAITGARGKIASALIELYRSRTNVQLLLISSKTITGGIEPENERFSIATASPHDFESYKSVLRAFRPDVIINTIGYTDVDGCETERDLAQLLNARFPEMLARYARTFDAHLIHYSTDYVFDGAAGPYDETQIPRPINYYGKTKLAGENTIRALGCSHTIIRTNVVYGFGGRAKNDFVEWVIRVCSANLPVRAVVDQFSNPTFSADIALATAHFAERRRNGLYHVGGADYCSRYEFALAIARVFDLRTDLIESITTEQLNQKAPRPLRGGLIALQAEAELGIRFSGIINGLVAYRRRIRQ